MDLCEFQISVVYTESFRPASDIEAYTILQSKERNKTIL